MVEPALLHRIGDRGRTEVRVLDEDRRQGFVRLREEGPGVYSHG